MKINLTLQEKLRDLRDERKLKQQEVAEQTGIPLATISRIESNDDNQTSYRVPARRRAARRAVFAQQTY